MSEDLVYKKAIRLLSGRDYSVFKLKKKLLGPGISETQVQSVLDKLIRQHLLREENYVDAFIRGKMRKGQGVSAIQKALAVEKIECSREEILAVFEREGVSETGQLQKLFQKKLPSKIPLEFLERQKLKRKLQTFGLSKGHDYDQIINLLNQIF